jgi:PKD repeat protein
MNKNIFKFGMLALMLLISVALVASPAAADPVMTRTLSDSTIVPGQTVHVTLELTNYVDEQSINSMQEYYTAAEMDGWTVSNVELPPECPTALHMNGSGVDTFMLHPDFTGVTTLPAGDYTVEYDLTVNASTSPAVYDLTGKYLDSGNSTGYPAVGDTQLTVRDPELYNDTVSLYPEDRTDLGALEATGLSNDGASSFLSTIDGIIADYGATPEESVGWSVWVNDELTPLGIGQNVVEDGDVVKFTYNSYTGSEWDPNMYDQRYVVIITVNEQVPPAPTADFEADVTSGDAPLTVQFTDLSADVHGGSWAWDFDNDGTIDSTDQNPAYTYNTPGTYSVNLTVTNEGGSNNTVKTNFIVANMPPVPVAIFEVNETLGAVPMAVSFTDLSTNATSWAWDFDNDGSVDSTDQNPTYTYNTAGTYTVNLTVTNLAGVNTSVMTDMIEAVDLPVADFEANVTSSESAPLTVQFNDTSTGGEAIAWQWDFDNDGSVDSTDQNPIYTYNTTGTYTVNLTVTNAVDTDVETKVDYIRIVKPRSSSGGGGGTGSARIISSVETPVPPVEEDEPEVIEEESVADNNNDGDSAGQVSDDFGSQGEAEYQEPYQQKSDPDTPGFEMIFAVIGLLMSVYLAKRY